MARRWHIAGLSGALAAGVLLGFPALPAQAKNSPDSQFFASPEGSGSECTKSAPCSLTGVRDLVRSKTATMSGDITVSLRGGTYRLSEPLSLGTRDSGQNGHQVVWAAYHRETPLISGAKKVSGFALHDSAKNIYRASVPAGTKSRQLFVDGVRAGRARGALDPAGFTLSGSSFTTNDASYASFTNQSQVEVVDNNAWKHMRCPLQSITSTSNGGSSLNVDPDCFANNNTQVPNVGFPFNGSGLPKLNGVSWIENAYQLLSKPGQFYLDSSAGQVYYIPRPGEDLASADVELPVTEQLLDLSGTPGHLAPVNNDDKRAVYTGSSWGLSSNRIAGDLGNDVKYATANGNSVSFTFEGTGLQVLSELNPDQGDIDVYVDDVKTDSVSTVKPHPRLAQQAVASVTGLPKGTHTVKLVKTSGTYMLIDGFTVIPDVLEPVHDITFKGVDFAYTTWNQPSTSGYIDNQAGVLWDPVTRKPVRIPAAVQVHRGSRITFTDGNFQHLGGTGIDLADGTQDSTVTGSRITDTSGGGISLGEVDDYYQTQTALMTSGDTLSHNTITHVGQEYQDAVGIWAGYTRNAVLSRNEIGYTPYSGISLGWGWGWASPYLQGISSRHGTNYAGDNQILNNHVHNHMGVLHDGGAIYTLGGQGEGGGMTSVLAGNVLAEGNNTNNMIYHDEGSSYWNTHDNVVRFGGKNWVGMWVKSIHDNNIHDNYSDNPAYLDVGTNMTLEQATVVTDGAWPAAARSVIAAAGPKGRYKPHSDLVDDDALSVAYSGSWQADGHRGLGDYLDGIHSTNRDGDSVTITFSGTSIGFLTETNTDKGLIKVTLDGVDKGTVDAQATGRNVRQTLFRSGELKSGVHTLTLTKAGGSVMLVDGFDVAKD
ncbi:hypothetical protein ACFVT5_35855 [Streptomyces sp. NPDC058001]|uniref:hypothetical protein n=1 Tax=Streptomyces sp. NPDC058001 TaxID=3346300 RepID=UPI0036E5ECDB